MYVCVFCVWLCTPEYSPFRIQKRVKKGLDPPRLGVMDSYEPPDVGAEN